MLKAQKTSTRWWVLMPLTGICFGMTLIASGAFLPPTLPPILPCPGVSWTPPSGGFPQPQVRRSLNGLLWTTLHACISTNKMLDQNRVPPVTVEFHPPTFEGTIPAPTLSVKPGDKLSILMVNDLPANPLGNGVTHFPHDENTFNLHTHGLTVSPLGISDNIFREMKPGTVNRVEINIPPDHPSGTYWYHVHKHGSATYQFLGGMAGFLIVQGGPGTLDTVPEVAAAKDVPMAFQVVRSLSDGSVVFVHEQAQQFGTFPFPDFTKTTHRSFRHPHNRVSGAHTAWMANCRWNRMAKLQLHQADFPIRQMASPILPCRCSPVRCSGGGCSTPLTVTTFS